MAASRQVDLLEPIDLAEHLDKVELYLGQVCQIAGISKMQLDYWTNKAQIPTKGKKQRIYDIDALETVMLIKQAKDKGLNLGAAIDAARRFREQSAAASSAAARRRGPSAARACCAPPPRAAACSRRCRRRARGRRGCVSRGNSTRRQSGRRASQALSGAGPSSACRRRTSSTSSRSAGASSSLRGRPARLGRRDHELVRQPARRGAASDERRPLGDDCSSRRARAARAAAAREPDELRVRVRQARAGLPPSLTSAWT